MYQAVLASLHLTMKKTRAAKAIATIPSLCIKGKTALVTGFKGKKQLVMGSHGGEQPIKAVDVDKVIGMYQKKSISRMKSFYQEAQRMDKKFAEIIDKLAEMGVKIDSLGVNALDNLKVMSARKRSKAVHFNIRAHRQSVALYGTWTVTPASMKVSLYNSDRMGWAHSFGGRHETYYVVYYKNLVVRNNFIANQLSQVGKQSTVDDFSF